MVPLEAPLVWVSTIWRRVRIIGAAMVVVSAFPAEARSQLHPAEPHRHPEAQALSNPAAATPETMKNGAALYARHCASCHGPNGLGNGRLAAGMAAYGARPSDLTDADWQHGSSEGEVFAVVKDGLGSDSQMPAYGGRLAELDIWHVVQFIRSWNPSATEKR